MYTMTVTLILKQYSIIKTWLCSILRYSEKDPSSDKVERTSISLNQIIRSNLNGEHTFEIIIYTFFLFLYNHNPLGFEHDFNYELYYVYFFKSEHSILCFREHFVINLLLERYYFLSMYKCCREATVKLSNNTVPPTLVKQISSLSYNICTIIQQ